MQNIKYKNLVVVTEVDYSESNKMTRNRSLNVILEEYGLYFDKIHVIMPGENLITYQESKIPNIFLSTFNTYGKALKSRVNFIFSFGKSKRFNELLSLTDNNIVQFRSPSIFAMTLYYISNIEKNTITSYIAGEWKSSFELNYDFVGSKLIGGILERLQYSLIRNSVPVSAGKVLSDKYKNLNNVYPYFSTTHKDVLRISKSYKTINLMYVGRLEKLKRIEDAIVAVKLLKDDLGLNNTVEFNIIGEGDHFEELNELVKINDLGNNVFFHGYINDKTELDNYYRAANVFLFPSVSEGTPKVLAEAMSFGVIPIAVKTTGSVKYIVKDKKNGFLVAPLSSKQIAESLANYVNMDVSEKENMSNQCFEYAEEHTIQKEVNKMWTYIFKKVN